MQTLGRQAVGTGMNRQASGGVVILDGLFDGHILGTWGGQGLKLLTNGHEGVAGGGRGTHGQGEGSKVRTPLTRRWVMESTSRWWVTSTKSWKWCRKSAPRLACWISASRKTH